MQTSHRLRRIAALTLTLLIVLPLSLVAARWQWNRHLEKETRNALISAAETQPARPIAQLLDPAGALSPGLEWRQAQLSGKFLDRVPTLWRKQPLDGQPGFIGLARFQPTIGRAVLVELGWVPAAGLRPAKPVNQLDVTREQQLVGYLRLLPDCETRDPADIPAGQTNCPLTRLQPADAQVLLQLQDPAGPWTDLGLPELDAGPHLGYVGQWLLIGLTAIITYIALLRRLDEIATPAK